MRGVLRTPTGRVTFPRPVKILLDGPIEDVSFKEIDLV
jgi:hypothetical protein